MSEIKDHKSTKFGNNSNVVEDGSQTLRGNNNYGGPPSSGGTPKS